MPEGPFGRREPGRNPIASELDRLAEQERVGTLGRVPGQVTGPMAGPYNPPAVGEATAQRQQLVQLAHQEDPNEPPDLAAEREPRRRLLASMSLNALAFQAEVADAQLRKAFAQGRAYIGPDGSVHANDDPNDEIGSNLDIIREWKRRTPTQQ